MNFFVHFDLIYSFKNKINLIKCLYAFLTTLAWTERWKQIAKIWRSLPADKKAPFLQKARENRAAVRLQKTHHQQQTQQVRPMANRLSLPIMLQQRLRVCVCVCVGWDLGSHSAQRQFPNAGGLGSVSLAQMGSSS